MSNNWRHNADEVEDEKRMEVQEESRLSENWDTIYRGIHRAKLFHGLIQQLPADTCKLLLSNYAPMLHADHRNTRGFDPSICNGRRHPRIRRSRIASA